MKKFFILNMPLFVALIMIIPETNAETLVGKTKSGTRQMATCLSEIQEVVNRITYRELFKKHGDV